MHDTAELAERSREDGEGAAAKAGGRRPVGPLSEMQEVPLTALAPYGYKVDSSPNNRLQKKEDFYQNFRVVLFTVQ